MKKLLALTILLAAAALSGCGLADTDISERNGRYKDSLRMSSRMVNDDWDNFWMVDRPSHRTYWYVRAGQ